MSDDPSFMQSIKRKRPSETSSSSEGSSMLVFSSSLCQVLSRERLAPVYVGVRSIRPTKEATIRQAHGSAAENSQGAPLIRSLPPPVYKVTTDDGQERRMTAQEKKRAKLQYKSQKASQLAPAVTVPTAMHDPSPWPTSSKYVQLTVDPLVLAEELAEGRPHDIPPVLLSPPLAQLAWRLPAAHVRFDDQRAAQWATALKQSMARAEVSRQQEDLRPMPYHIVPEVWTRMRPAAEDNVPRIAGPVVPDAGHPSKDWSWCNLQSPTTADHNDNAAAVLQLLHPHLHISCGAKFGCHYLLYDGPRQERHALAGLRILPRGHALPNAYDLAGYVRCLNTAGKLALLATTVPDEDGCRVLILDLALEKRVVTTSRRPKKTLEQRMQNLSKSTKC